ALATEPLDGGCLRAPSRAARRAGRAQPPTGTRRPPVHDPARRQGDRRCGGTQARDRRARARADRGRGRRRRDPREDRLTAAVGTAAAAPTPNEKKVAYSVGVSV